MLINCPECGKEVSSEATVCIHCGYPIAKVMAMKRAAIRKKEAEEQEAILKSTNSPRKTYRVFDKIQIISIPVTAFFIVIFCIELIATNLKIFDGIIITYISLSLISFIICGIIMIIVFGILKACFKRR